MKRTLREITEDMQVLDDLLNEREGDITDPEVEAAINAWFEENADNLEDKIDGYFYLISHAEAEYREASEEAARCAAIAQHHKGRADQYRNRLKWWMEQTGNAKVSGKLHTISLANNGGPLPVVIPDDVAATDLPFSFQRRTETINVDKEAILNALQRHNCNELIINGRIMAAIGERGKHLRFK